MEGDAKGEKYSASVSPNVGRKIEGGGGGRREGGGGLIKRLFFSSNILLLQEGCGQVTFMETLFLDCSLAGVHYS